MNYNSDDVDTFLQKKSLTNKKSKIFAEHIDDWFIDERIEVVYDDGIEPWM